MKLSGLFLRLLLFAVTCSGASAREWTDATGKYKIEAEFGGLMMGEVRLKTAEGRTIELPLEKLSLADQDYIKSLRNRPTSPRAGTQPAAQPSPTTPSTAKATEIRGGREAIEKELARPTTCNFEKTPLSEVARELAQQHKIPVTIYQGGLQDVGRVAGHLDLAAGHGEPARGVALLQAADDGQVAAIVENSGFYVDDVPVSACCLH